MKKMESNLIELVDKKKLWKHMQNFLKQKYVEELENYIEKEISNNLGIYIVRDGKKKIKHYSIFGEVDINLSRIKRNDTNIQIEKILESTSKFIRDFI
ncbi:hypothetical protein EI74_0656, partial [Mycoplasma testudineum]